MEQLEYIPKKVYEGTINKLTAMAGTTGGQLVCVSGDIEPSKRMGTVCMYIDQAILNGQQVVTGAYAAFPIYNTELAHWAPGKRLRVTVEVVD